MFRSSSFLFFLLLFAGHVYAQGDNDPLMPGSTFEISGQVRSGDNKTIPNVIVRLESGSGALVDEGAADSMGRFRFSRLRPGQYRVSAKAAGVVAAPQTVDINRNSPRQYVLLQLVAETDTFRSRVTTRPGTIDARVPEEARTALEKARAAVTDKKSAEAITQLQKAIHAYADFFDAQLLLGNIYLDEGQWEKAEAALRRALQIDPKAVGAMVSLGEVLRRRKNYTEAQKLLDGALKLDKDSWEANYTLGRVYWELKDIPKSGLYTARTLQLQPNLAEAHLLAGNIFMRAGLPSNALVEYREYLRLAPKGEFAVQTQELVDKLQKSLSERKN
jgi:tetratricopeptide (TPR) repeat protein